MPKRYLKKTRDKSRSSRDVGDQERHIKQAYILTLLAPVIAASAIWPHVWKQLNRVSTTNSVSALKGTIAGFASQLNDRDQEMLYNDLKIAGIPGENNESSVHLILTVATTLGVSQSE
ncbi:hypothetical protein EVAR_53722_1 [Eumeta japonica]|uniref:Uncharacterized protein n=1 Tax=Eumeta variegata TaxID=151549 RepID=A0A4C1YZ25_EUMVA|nr:hypothetical protein EVAR_53722_1 [Eumeta japonica]